MGSKKDEREGVKREDGLRAAVAAENADEGAGRDAEAKAIERQDIPVEVDAGETVGGCEEEEGTRGVGAKDQRDRDGAQTAERDQGREGGQGQEEEGRAIAGSEGHCRE